MNERPRDKSAHETQQRILDAAVEIIADRGFSAAATSDIAKKANVAEGTIFRHFKTKKDLLVAVLAPVAERIVVPVMLGDFRKLLQKNHESFEELARAVFKDRLNIVKRHPKVVRIMLQEMPFHEELRAVMRRVLLEEVLPDARAAIARLQAKGLVVDEQPERLLRTMASSIMAYVLLRVVFADGNEAWNDEEEIEAMVRILAHGVSTKPRIGSPSRDPRGNR